MTGNAKHWRNLTKPVFKRTTRCAVAAAGLLLAASLPTAASAQQAHSAASPVGTVASEKPLGGESLYRDVMQYAALGEHRTGTTADHQTSQWLADELDALGFDVELQRFPLRQFFPDSTQLTIGDRVINAFPHWFPTVTTEPVKATLVELPLKPYGETSGISSGKPSGKKPLAGHIAYLSPGRAPEWYQLDVSSLTVQAAAQGALALVVAVPHPSGSIYARNAAEPYLQNALPIPTLVVPATDSGQLDRALSTQQPVTLALTGRIEEQAYGANVLARLDRGGDWIVVSTPSSGWFTAAGERGGGVALWLGAARWVASNDKHNSYLFVSNSGHELDMLGSKHSLAQMPEPDKVKLWLHLGASIGTRQWQQTDSSIEPLEQHNDIYLFAHWRQLWAAWRNFSKVPGLKLLPSFLLPPDRGELVHFIEAGYPAMGFVGDHRYFHTPEDKPVVNSAGLLAPYGNGVKTLLESVQP